MGGLNVKNTIAERALQIIAPHPCYGCGKKGNVLCDYCKYDIIHEPFVGCILCGRPNLEGACQYHASPFRRVYTVSTRAGTLKHIIDGLKFSHNKSAAKALADLLHDSLPLFPAGTIIVPIPTIPSHIRTRGYDHVGVIAQHLSSLRGMPIAPLLIRRTRTVQHAASNATARRNQAETAFAIKDSDIEGRSVLVLDDIVTTGSTLVAAGRLLQEAGAYVYGAALAYQPLD